MDQHPQVDLGLGYRPHNPTQGGSSVPGVARQHAKLDRFGSQGIYHCTNRVDDKMDIDPGVLALPPGNRGCWACVVCVNSPAPVFGFDPPTLDAIQPPTYSCNSPADRSFGWVRTCSKGNVCIFAKGKGPVVGNQHRPYIRANLAETGEGLGDNRYHRARQCHTHVAPGTAVVPHSCAAKREHSFFDFLGVGNQLRAERGEGVPAGRPVKQHHVQAVLEARNSPM